MTILVLNGMVFVIIWDMLHGRVSLKLCASAAASDFVNGFRLELTYKYPSS